MVDINLAEVAKAMCIDNLAAFRTGYDDGKEQGFELSVGMSYDDPYDQWAYDVGTYIGACIAVHPDTLEN